MYYFNVYPLGVNGTIVLMHKADKQNYKVRRDWILAVMVTLGEISLLGTIYCIYGSLTQI